MSATNSAVAEEIVSGGRSSLSTYSRHLTIQQVVLEDSGLYRCIASLSGSGNPDVAGTANVTVLGRICSRNSFVESLAGDSSLRRIWGGGGDSLVGSSIRTHGDGEDGRIERRCHREGGWA